MSSETTLYNHPFPPEKLRCPHFRCSCREMVTSDACDRWLAETLLQTETQKMVIKYACLDRWAVFWAAETAKISQQGGKETETLRNELMGAITKPRPVIAPSGPTKAIEHKEAAA